MSAQACYPGDPYPGPYWQGPYPCYPQYGTAITTWYAPLTEDRVREIIREELTKAREALKKA